MSDSKNKEVTKSDVNGVKAPNEKRRALTKAALSAPVIGALASTPALGQGRICTVSVLMSGDASIPIDYTTCAACSPGFWFAAPNKDCFWPSDLNKSTHFGAAFVPTITSDNDDPEIKKILDDLIEYPIGQFKTDHKKDFKDRYPKEYTQTADALFMFCRAATADLLNAKTLGAMFPILLLNNALHTVDEIQDLVEDIFTDNNYTTTNEMKSTCNDYADELSADWDHKETEICNMFGTCPK